MVIEHLHDNTARIKAEKATETEKERLAVTLRSIGDGVITTDTDGRVLLINRVAEELTGWPQEEACGRPIGEVFHIINELSRKPWENPVQKVLESGNIIELANHTLLISRQGTERIIADSGAPIKDVSGATIGVVLVFRDMTEKQKLIDATQKNQKLEALGVLAAGIAHDFNNLLGGVFGYIDLAKQEMQDAGHSPQYLDDAVSAVERARGLTAQLLTFAKGSAPIIKAGSIATVIKEAVQFALSGTNVSATFAFDSILGSALFDKNQISQVIDNMVINATHAMPRGGEIIVSGSTVHIEEKQHPELPAGEYVKISIADSGIGIPRDILPNIFDPFFTTKAKGSGLGLATSYSILKKHGGTIEVESQQGKGTTFHLYVPATGDAQGTTEDSAQGLHTGKGHILVMDDEMVLRRVLTKMLEKCGYTVETASTGEQALARYSEAKKHGPAFDAVILDLTISGGMGGRETVKRLRDMGETLPVFVASGYASEEIMADPERFGFTASLSKPFMMRELSDMLHTHIIKES
jgi:PAS domain S-box-containing protein